jgi:hypothetical protein
MQANNRLFLSIFAQILITLPLILSGSRVEAADSVLLKYGVLRESISVSDLTALAETGEPSGELEFYLRLAKRQPQDLQLLLTKPIQVDGVLLSQFLNSLPGVFLLDVLGEFITTPSGRASRESLRGALVSSALPDGDIKLIEVFQNYPTSEIHIEGDRLAEIYENIKGVLDYLPKININ